MKQLTKEFRPIIFNEKYCKSDRDDLLWRIFEAVHDKSKEKFPQLFPYCISREWHGAPMLCYLFIFEEDGTLFKWGICRERKLFWVTNGVAEYKPIEAVKKIQVYHNITEAIHS